MSEDIEDIEELRETLREEISELREDITWITEEIRYLREQIDSVNRVTRVVEDYEIAFRNFLSEVNPIRFSFEDGE